jgi:pimeloyl-ACP methyl ester carboxylesterase
MIIMDGGFPTGRVECRTTNFFVQHLRELLAALEEKGEFDLLVYSMGGAIASAFAAKHP